MSYLDSLLDDRIGKRMLVEEQLITRVTEQVIKVMKEKGLHQADLARDIGVNPPRISRLLSGKANMTLKTLAKIAIALDEPVHVSIGECNESRINDVSKRLTKVERQLDSMKAFRDLEKLQQETANKIRSKVTDRKTLAVT